MSQTGLRFTVSVGNFPAETFAVTRFHLSQSYSSLFTLDIHIVSERTTLQASELLEQTARLAIWQGDTPLTVSVRTRSIFTTTTHTGV